MKVTWFLVNPSFSKSFTKSEGLSKRRYLCRISIFKKVAQTRCTGGFWGNKDWLFQKLSIISELNLNPDYTLLGIRLPRWTPALHPAVRIGICPDLKVRQWRYVTQVWVHWNWTYHRETLFPFCLCRIDYAKYIYLISRPADM